jgi:radical SAM superfamily enzyme YgiQ (UPF0313 family)
MSDETGAIRKDPGGRLNVALVYPNTYWVGMSNLGVHTMYRVLNDNPAIVCERFFLDSERSVESGRRLSDFHVVAFSVSYELDWVNLLAILMKNGIPLKARDRGGSPLVMAGGAAATINPEPVAEVLDLCFLGEGEPLADAFAQAYTESTGREAFLDSLSRVPGVYIPERLTPVYQGDTLTGFEGARPGISVMEPFDSPGYSVVLTDKTVFQDMFLAEIARGCPYHCKFCTAREIYAPFRPAPLESLEPVFQKARASGKKLGLVSTSLNNHPQLASILARIRELGMGIAPPSLRLGMISEDLLSYLEESRVNSVTLAPEVGSDALRRSLGKAAGNDDILRDVTSLVSRGVRDIKLYFLVGVPGETLDDVDAVIDLTKHVRQVFIQVSRGNRRLGKISLSVNTMVPKPHSRYQRLPMLEPDEAKARIKRIVKGLSRVSNVTVSFEGPKWAYLQALISRGDRRVLDVLTEMAGRDQGKWQQVLRSWHLNPDWYVLRERGEDEVLPWSFYSLYGRSPCAVPG